MDRTVLNDGITFIYTSYIKTTVVYGVKVKEYGVNISSKISIKIYVCSITRLLENGSTNIDDSKIFLLGLIPNKYQHFSFEIDPLVFIKIKKNCASSRKIFKLTKSMINTSFAAY